MANQDNARILHDFYLKKVDEIPSLPTIVIELIRLIDNPMSSSKQVEELLALDQGLSVKVLKLANSGFYAIPGGTSSIKRAIMFLGLNTVKQLVISASIAGQFRGLDSEDFKLDQFWSHAVSVAVLARAISKNLNLGDSEDCFTAGLIHDIGKLAYLIIAKDKFLDLLKFARENSISLSMAEQKLGLVSHSALGGTLAKRWQLPLVLQFAIKDHHTSKLGLRSVQDATMNLTTDIVILSNELAKERRIGASESYEQPSLDQHICERLKFNPNSDSNRKLIADSLEQTNSLVKAFIGE